MIYGTHHPRITVSLWRGIIPAGRLMGTHGRLIHWTLARCVRAANAALAYG